MRNLCLSGSEQLMIFKICPLQIGELLYGKESSDIDSAFK